MFNIRLCALALAGACALSTCTVKAGSLQEDFSADPFSGGWRVYGDAALFQWSATNQNLEVTWDSSRTNSYFYHPLGTILTKADDFSFSFELRLTDFIAGINPLDPGPFSLSVALLDFERASQTNFLRGTGADSPEVVEFSFFPDPGGAWTYGPSLTSILVDSTATNWSSIGFGAQTLTAGDLFQITLTYSASDQTLRTGITRNGQNFGLVSNAQLGTNFLDFRLNCIAICSYSDAGQDPMYAGSILAHGTIDNLSVNVPPPPVTSIVGGLNGGVWQVQFLSRTNWVYALERTLSFDNWTLASSLVPGNGAELVLRDTNAPSPKAFYRVRAQPGSAATTVGP